MANDNVSGAQGTSPTPASESQLPLLLIAPILAVITVSLWIWPSGSLSAASKPLVLDGVCSSYATGLFIFLILEGERTAVARRDRMVQLTVGLVGLALASVTVFISMRQLEPWYRVLGESIFLVAPSLGMLLSHRQDSVRAVIFGSMALATIRSRLVYPLPPYISIGLIAFVATAFFALRARLPSKPVPPRAALQMILGTLTTMLFLYGIFVAYQRASLSGVLLFSIGVLFFGGLTILRILLGDYWWLRRKR